MKLFAKRIASPKPAAVVVSNTIRCLPGSLSNQSSVSWRSGCQRAPAGDCPSAAPPVTTAAANAVTPALRRVRKDRLSDGFGITFPLICPRFFARTRDLTPRASYPHHTYQSTSRERTGQRHVSMKRSRERSQDHTIRKAGKDCLRKAQSGWPLTRYSAQSAAGISCQKNYSPHFNTNPPPATMLCCPAPVPEMLYAGSAIKIADLTAEADPPPELALAL